jgi:hypothetical protein
VGAKKLMQRVDKFRHAVIVVDELLPAMYSHHPNQAVRKVGIQTPF